MPLLSNIKMKTKLTLILSFVGSLALADVTVTESARVLVDGKDIGDVASAVKNGIATPSEVQTALVALLDSMKSGAATAEAARVKVITDTKAALAEVDAKAAVAAVIAAAEVPEKEKRKAKLDAEIAEKQAERAKLNK